ncbi:MAG: DUF1573 domain-containing protein [Nanoarchaeota archaeon]|nr:DUF1573 domain-containing protein [Nanoarchaeota archaeon]
MKKLPRKQKILLLTTISIIAILIFLTTGARAIKEDIYKEFTCTCCETSLLDTPDSCLMAEGMRSSIDNSALKYFYNKEKIMMDSVKKFGIPSLSRKEQKMNIGLKLINDTTSSFPSIQFDQDFVELGEISNSKGLILIDFTMENNGTADLIIYDVKTSCACLSASLIKDGQESLRAGRFSYPDGWNYIVKPNEKIILRGFYDPRITSWQTGSVERIITITSNDPMYFERSVRIAAKLVP